MKSPAPRKLKKLVILAVILIFLISISAWTALSPQVLSVQNDSQIAGSLFQFAKAEQLVNFTDGEGSYTFLFGADYNDSAAPGVPTIVEVFASLVKESIGSGFLRGIGLQMVHSTVLIDGVGESGFVSRTTTSDSILVERLSQLEINQTSGTHMISIHMIVSTVDVNYIGYLSGTEQVVNLNGTFSIS
ncbi:MAG TPA: hypothetical protein VN739_05545 [Nitrososphaerales archaeon]|nr:hypothetical protein [Nitrososphaerales archaeon]